MEQIFINILEKAGLPIAAILVILYVLFFPEKAQIISSYLWASISFFRRSASKKVISNRLEGHINQFSKNITKNLSGVPVRGVKIKWVKEESREAFLQKGNIVVKMHHHSNNNRNLATIAMLYIGKTIAPEAKKLLSKEISDSIDLFLAKDFLTTESPDAIDEFYEGYYRPLVEDKPVISNYFEQFQIIEKHGLFIRILLQELILVGNRFIFKADKKSVNQETNHLIDFLKNIVERQRGEHVPLKFVGNYTKIGIILVAKTHRREREGVKPYISRFQKMKKVGLEEIYLLAWDTKNMKFLEEVLITLRKDEDYYQRKVVNYKVEDKDCWFSKAKLAMFQQRDKKKENFK